MPTKTRANTKEKSFKVNTLKQEEIITQQLIDLFKSGKTFSDRRWTDTTMGELLNGKTKKSYQGTNVISLSLDMILNGYEHGIYLGFHQAKELKLSMIKGSKSAKVKAFVEIIQKDEKTKEIKKDKQGKPIKKACFPLKSVFNIGCFKDDEHRQKILDRLTVAPGTPKRDIGNHHEGEKIIEEYVKREKIKLNYGGNQCFYCPSLDSITLVKKENFKDIEAYVSTAIHEICHSTGAKHRLNRDSLTAPNSDRKQYYIEELIAELSATIYSYKIRCTTVDKLNNHSHYLKNYINLLEENPNILFDLLKQCNQCIKYIEEGKNEK